MRAVQELNEASPLLSILTGCERALATMGHRVVGKVQENQRAYDLAAIDRNGTWVAIRCVCDLTNADHDALKIMIAEGDFHRAFIIHSGDGPVIEGDIPTYPLSRIDELAALLAKESAP